MRKHAGPGFNPREQYRQRAHNHGFNPPAFLAAVDDYSEVAGLPWLVAADAVETHWLLEGEDLEPFERRVTLGAIPPVTLEEDPMTTEPEPGTLELLTVGLILGLSLWCGFALIRLITGLFLELLGLRGSAVVAALTGMVLTLAFNLGADR